MKAMAADSLQNIVLWPTGLLAGLRWNKHKRVKLLAGVSCSLVGNVKPC